MLDTIFCGLFAHSHKEYNMTITTPKDAVLIQLNELRNVKCYISMLLNDLRRCDSNTNLYKHIGIYARNMPEGGMGEDYHNMILDSVRKICTGELSVEDAIMLLQEKSKQIDDALAMFK